MCCDISLRHDSANLLASRYIPIALVSGTKHSSPSYLCLSIVFCLDISGGVVGTDIGGSPSPNKSSLRTRVRLVHHPKCSQLRGVVAWSGPVVTTFNDVWVDVRCG